MGFRRQQSFRLTQLFSLQLRKLDCGTTFLMAYTLRF